MDFRPIHNTAAPQCGQVTRRQLGALGLSERRIDLMVERGQMEAVHGGVYRLAGSAPSWRANVWAAALAGGPLAHVSHRTAIAWWASDWYSTEIVELVTDATAHVRCRGVRSHRTHDLPAADQRVHRGLAVTSIERSLIDAGRYLSAKEIGAALDHAVRDGLTTYGRFERRVSELARRGRNGIGTARMVLADRGFGDGFGFEKAMRGLLRDAGLPVPRREFRVHVDGCRYRVDFAFPEAMVGIECDSTRWHGLAYQREADLVRQNRIQNTGLLLLRFTVARLRTDRAGILREIAQAVARREGVRPPTPSAFPDVSPRETW